MALPNSVNPASPTGSDSPVTGDDELRGIKQYLVDVFGVPNNSNVTAAPMSISTAGAVSILQSPFTVPTQIRGAAAQILQISSQYSEILFDINGASILGITATGILHQTPWAEWTSGVTSILGTQGPQPIGLRTNNANRWWVNPSGMLIADADNVVDIGLSGANRPRTAYIASNIFLGGMLGVGTTTPTAMSHIAGGAYVGSNMFILGQISAGQGNQTLTTPTGMLDATKLTVSGESQGDLMIRGASGWTRLAGGTSGYLLRTQSTTANPTWVSGAPDGAYGIRGLLGANNTTTPNTKYDLSADLVVLRNSSSNSIRVVTNTGTLTCDIGQVQTGSAADQRDQSGQFSSTTGFVHFYFIGTGSGAAHTLASSMAPPTGPTLPSTYTEWAYAGAVAITGVAPGVLRTTYLRGSRAAINPIIIRAAAAGSGAEEGISVLSVAPTNLLALRLRARTNVAGNTPAEVRVVAGATGLLILGEAGLGNENQSVTDEIPAIVPTIFFIGQAGSSYSISALGYRIPNGGE